MRVCGKDSIPFIIICFLFSTDSLVFHQSITHGTILDNAKYCLSKHVLFQFKRYLELVLNIKLQGFTSALCPSYISFVNIFSFIIKL